MKKGEIKYFCKSDDGYVGTLTEENVKEIVYR